MVPVCFNKFFRLPICLAKDNLIINTGRSSVSSVQFHSHKLLQSWTLKQPCSFSCPAVYVAEKNELLCVVDKNILVTWNYEADNLEDANKIKFQEAIFAIVSAGNQLIVVFDSGLCLLLEHAILKHEFILKPYLKNEDNLLWADALPYESNYLIFLLTYTSNDGHELHSLILNISDGQIEKSSKQAISRDSVSLRSWCMKAEDMNMSFITAWSDGQVHSYTDYRKSPVHLLTIPEIEDKEMLAMEAFDACHIVIVRCHPSHECSYEIWDTRYSTKKSCKSIDLSLSENLQIRILGDTLFLPSNQSVVAEPLNVAFSTLSAVVGKSSNADEMQGGVLYSWAPDCLLHQEYTEDSCGDISSHILSAVTRNELFEELLSRLHQGDTKTISSCLREVKFISESKLAKLLQHLLRENHLELIEKVNGKNLASKSHAKHLLEIFLEFFYIPYNDIFLQQHLRKLSFKEVTATLEILLLLLKEGVSRSSRSGNQWHSLVQRHSSYSQIPSWACLLLFSHFEEFVLFAEKEMYIMADLLKILSNKLTTYDEVGDLLRFQHKKLNFEKSTNAMYCIESLHL